MKPKISQMLFHEKHPEILKWRAGDQIKISWFGPLTYMYCGVSDNHLIILYDVHNQTYMKTRIQSCKNLTMLDRFKWMENEEAKRQLETDYNKLLHSLQEQDQKEMEEKYSTNKEK